MQSYYCPYFGFFYPVKAPELAIQACKRHRAEKVKSYFPSPGRGESLIILNPLFDSLVILIVSFIDSLAFITLLWSATLIKEWWVNYASAGSQRFSTKISWEYGICRAKMLVPSIISELSNSGIKDSDFSSDNFLSLVGYNNSWTTLTSKDATQDLKFWMVVCW